MTKTLIDTGLEPALRESLTRLAQLAWIDLILQYFKTVFRLWQAAFGGEAHPIVRPCRVFWHTLPPS
jgi:hypothetical protein